jgi:hypothetical protein
MTPVEARALIRKALRRRTRLRVLSEDEREWSDQDNTCQVTEQMAKLSIKGKTKIPKPKVPKSDRSSSANSGTHSLSGDMSNMVPPKKRGRPRKEDFMTVRKSE